MHLPKTERRHNSKPRSAQAVQKWKETMGDRPHPHLLDEKKQILVCKLLGQFKEPSEVARALLDRFHLKINPASLYHYLNHPVYAPLIEKYRSEYALLLTHVPLYHKRVRLERLENQYQEAEGETAGTIQSRRFKRKELRDIIGDAREECRPFEEIQVSSQTNISILQLNALDDKTLLKKKEEIMERITKIGGNPNGRRNRAAAQEDLPGGVREGEAGGEGEPSGDSQREAEGQLP